MGRNKSKVTATATTNSRDALRKGENYGNKQTNGIVSAGKATTTSKKSKTKPSQATTNNIRGGGSASFPSYLISDINDYPSNFNTNKYSPPVTCTALLPNFIWTVENFFSPPECQAWIDYIERDEAMEYFNQRATRYMASRECYRLSKQDPDMAHRLYERMRQRIPNLFDFSASDTQASSLSVSSCCVISLPVTSGGRVLGRPITCNPNLRLYKYTEGHSFSQHYDGSNTVDGVGETRLTVLIYLSDCHGGATRFFPPPNLLVDNTQQKSKKQTEDTSLAFTPKTGAMLLHLHGDDCLLHQADPVVKGTKYVLRTDIVYATS